MNTAELGINEWEALCFFGSDPISREYGTEWFDSDSVYEVVRGDLRLTCAIHPIHRDVRLILSSTDNRIFEWNAMGLIDICYIEEKERTVIRFVSSDEDETVLRVAPSIEITRKSNGPNRVGTGIEPAPPTPPGMRVRTGRFPSVMDSPSDLSGRQDTEC